MNEYRSKNIFFRKTRDLYMVQNVTDETRMREGTQSSTLGYIFQIKNW